MDQIVNLAEILWNFLQSNSALIAGGGIALIGLTLLLWTAHRIRQFRLKIHKLRQELEAYHTSSLSLADLEEIAELSSKNRDPRKLLRLLDKRLADKQNSLSHAQLSTAQVREYSHLLTNLETNLPRYYWLDFFQYLSILYAGYIGLLLLVDAFS
jgi:hypothetical protein